MNILDKLNQDMKDAMRNKEKQRLMVIRSVKSALQNEAINKGEDLSEDEVLTVLSREMKQRKESLHEFEQAARTDLVEKTNADIQILTEYMPSPLSDSELRQIVEETVNETGASSKADMGKVMGAIMPKVKGRADGSKVKEYVQQSLI
ncbi:GatB/YqeY domain-containing protein [Salipaludibacillus sp. LMS25]|uniref:GatB/YqeY domain-containing protein n=1 Tax=Salipaludibacillus sp. LMS25 TaxID=2924031 RepID=UPI0020D15F8D|nr:GatB/YqeY domain-containing protein [Salipaludibacillus sp. LMS25]UTR14370.1 GatB/YqeY domain-containing protein [Salipaludibacillus sp. LMS25]